MHKHSLLIITLPRIFKNTAIMLKNLIPVKTLNGNRVKLFTEDHAEEYSFDVSTMGIS